jgi:hypothetical protein
MHHNILCAVSSPMAWLERMDTREATRGAATNNESRLYQFPAPRAAGEPLEHGAALCLSVRPR